jgi:acyl dehydratase
MPLSSSVVGSATTLMETRVDSRWTMAFAAGIGDLSPRYLDTRRPEGLVAHPLFPVCVEWPVVLAARHLADEGLLAREEAARGIHLGHDLTVHRLVRPGDVLSTTATVDGVSRHRAGALQELRLETVNSSGAAVSTTRMSTLFLGVDVDGDDRPAQDGAEVGGGAPTEGTELAVGVDLHGGDAHVYSECSRIWNPIHTDPVVAEAAGLPGIILHGTATLALAVTAVVDRFGGGDPGRVSRLGGRFGAMVPLPSQVEIRAWPSGPSTVGFEVVTADGGRAVRGGFVQLDDG